MEKVFKDVSIILKEKLKDDIFCEENFSDWLFNREYPPNFAKKCFDKIAGLMNHYMCSEVAILNLYLEKVKVADEIMELLLYEE